MDDNIQKNKPTSEFSSMHSENKIENQKNILKDDFLSSMPKNESSIVDTGLTIDERKAATPDPLSIQNNVFQFASSLVMAEKNRKKGNSRSMKDCVSEAALLGHYIFGPDQFNMITQEVSDHHDIRNAFKDAIIKKVEDIIEAESLDDNTDEN